MADAMDSLNEKDLMDCRKSANEWVCPVEVCSRVLSRKQTLKTHLSCVHDIYSEVPSKRYKLYESDSSASMPRSTYYRKRKNDNGGKETEEDEGHITFLGDQIPCLESQTEGIDHEEVSDDLLSDMDMSSDTSDNSELCSSESSDSSDTECVGNSTPIPSKDVSNNAPLYVVQSSSGEIYSAKISQDEHVMAVAAYASRHNLSDTAIKHLTELIGLHLPENNLLNSDVDKFKEKCGFTSTFMKYFSFCRVCNGVFNDGNNRCSTPNCNGQRFAKKTQSYFATGNLDVQLKEVLTRDGVWDSIQEVFDRVQSSTITDITDGAEYRKLKQEGGFLNNRSNISLTMFTDGIPLFKSSGVSLWPVYLLINEIPRTERFLRKNMILWGIWQGSGKPNMTIFLNPLVQDLQKIYHEGITLPISGVNTVCKAAMVVATIDLQARSSVLNMTQHNGEHSCVYCMHPGKVVKSGKGHCRCFPYTEEPLIFRTAEEICRDGKDAQRLKKRVNGFTGESVLNYLPNFTLNNNIVVDYMHGLLLGIAKKFLSLWFDVKYVNQPYFIGNRINEVDKTLKSITPPYLIKRLPRKLTNTMHHWKASELRSWILFYALPSLHGILPELYLIHLSTLVEAAYLLLGEGITEDDIRRADLLLTTFVKTMERLYTLNVVGLNVHNLLHLTDCVRKWGPMWAWSCFSFESFNGEIKKSVHGTGNVCRQIFWALQAQKRVENVSSQPLRDNMKEFFSSVYEGKPSSEKVLSAYQCLVKKTTPLPENFVFADEIRAKLIDLVECDDASLFLKAGKIVRNGFIIYSKLCTKVKKRNSYTVTINSVENSFEV